MHSPTLQIMQTFHYYILEHCHTISVLRATSSSQRVFMWPFMSNRKSDYLRSGSRKLFHFPAFQSILQNNQDLNRWSYVGKLEARSHPFVKLSFSRLWTVQMSVFADLFAVPVDKGSSYYRLELLIRCSIKVAHGINQLTKFCVCKLKTSNLTSLNSFQRSSCSHQTEAQCGH